MAPTEIELARIKRFVRMIRNKPFVALVCDGNKVRLFSREMSPELVRQVREALAEISNEEG